MSRTVRPPRKVPASANVLTIMGLSEKQAAARTRNHPGDPRGWKSLGAHCLEAGRLAEARGALERALDLAPRDAEGLRVMADLQIKEGRLEDAHRHLDTALGIEPDHLLGRIKLAEILHRLGRNEEALQCLEKSTAPAGAHRGAWLSWHGVILLAMQRYDEARLDFEAQIEIEPKEYSPWNNLGNVYRDTGDLDQAECCYARAAALTKVDPLPKSNHLTALHYQPGATVEHILEACKDWGAMFAPAVRPERPVPADRSPAKVLRIGMFSDGFRQHPVGTMTVSALEHLAKLGVEIYAYTTNNSVDAITRRFMALARQWTPIYHLDDEQFAARIVTDQIDILIDLSGHNAGSRIRAMTMEPAPILVKWVGGLINTTGVEAIDYLISDRIESPLDSDHLYTEKLIRMPDDYICFVPPPKPPEMAPLPALRNGYITFGCFNNPTKINKVLLARWAELMHAVPQSRLFLKGAAYTTQELRQRVVDTLAEHGIGEDRLRIEGRSPHLELLARYNDVDIALDPWPYSGGLTTCEAMLMGVPVITLPGPTFAGRHSATHLANADMPELVAHDWEQYQARAVELTRDLNSLATIRSHLRQVLLDSPVCDPHKFARHLADALRAIWQRYCAGKAPAALALGKDGTAWFEDEDQAVQLSHPPVAHDPEKFDFTFSGRIMVVDHGGLLVGHDAFSHLNRLNALSIVALDPAGKLDCSGSPDAARNVQHHAHIALGDGAPATLHVCLDNSLSGTLEPLPGEQQSGVPAHQATTVVARIPLPTVRLDGIEGLSHIDWLVLDDANDNLKILKGAGRILDTVLITQIRVRFSRIFQTQPYLSDFERLLDSAGFRLLRLNSFEHGSYCGEAEVRPHAGSQLLQADAVFIPNDARLRTLTDDQRLKLAFLLHIAYQLPDAAYTVLAATGKDTAQRYLKHIGWLKPEQAAPSGASLQRAAAHNQHGYDFLETLCTAIDKHTTAVTRVLPQAYHWRGMDLRRAVERQLFFVGLYSEAPFQAYLHAIGERDTAPELGGYEQRVLLPFFDRDEIRHSVDYSNEKMKRRKVGDGHPVMRANMNAGETETGVLAVITHPKFALYLHPILQGLRKSGFSYLSVFNEQTEEWLRDNDYPSVAVGAEGNAAQTAPCSTVLLNYAGLLQLADATLAALARLRPKCVVVPEGNAPQDIITLEACKLLGIPCYCVQQGWAPYVHTGFRNMAYTGMFVWGERFKDVLSPWNPDQHFLVSGSHVLPSPPAEKAHAPVFGFFLQRPNAQLHVDTFVSFINLIIDFARAHPEAEIVVRPHPGYPLSDGIMRVLQGLPNVRISNPFEQKLADVLASLSVAVGINSTVLLEAIRMNVVPLVCSIGAYKKYPFDFTEMGIGYEVSTTADARRHLDEMLRAPGSLAAMRQRQKEVSAQFFADVDAARFIADHLEGAIAAPRSGS
ncbi:tetratricopeptide repeat protein [Bordetella petrii]|uniref:O-linked N-acetylglucosamine transferase, SPINDLY family protein n=1 Tax=Bordetella petrii TaxID=94624 RepID=UPI001A97AD49|nr:tetratricopeptide repeat protein [Bordetella petrii]MBO1111127.1 tetratricopeptide repeat protein [Bordetella petrii]